MSLVLALGYCPQDRAQAADLCRLIADLQPTKREDVRIRLVARHDCETLDMDTIQYLGRRFDVSWAHSASSASGWPHGPNMMAKDILGTSPHWLREAGWRDAIGILMLEPDACPLHPTWLDRLIAQWQLAMLDGCWIMGSWRNSGGEHGHINGNCVIDPRQAVAIARHIDPHLAWDCQIYPHVRQHACISGLFLNLFQRGSVTEAELRVPETGGVPPVLVHGVKSGDALAISRRWNLAPTPA